MIRALLSLLFLCGTAALCAHSEAVDTAYLWRQAIGGAVIGHPTVQAGSVVVVLDGGNVKAYSAAGRPLWDFSARGRISPFVTRSREGTVYICRTNGTFIALSRIGRELWRAAIGGGLSGPAVVGWDGRIFIPTARALRCYTASGNALWTQELPSPISAGPWLDQSGGVLLVLENGDAVRVNHYGELSVRRLPSIPRVLLSVAGAYAADFTVMALYADGAVQLFDYSAMGTFALRDAPRLPAQPLAAASSGSHAAVALDNGQLVLLSGADGSVLWIADTHDRARQEREAAVVYDERGIYVLSPGGAAGFTADGRRLWFTTLTGSSGIPAFDDEGILYSGGMDWILYAWKLENRPLRHRRSLYGPDPAGAYRVGISPPSEQAAAAGYYDELFVQRELERIQREILAGRVGAHENEWLAYLMDVSGGGIRHNAFSSSRPRALMSQRILALQLVSRIGSSETIPALVRLFRMEGEPLVKAAVARAIGGIGVDPQGLAIQTFLAAARSDNPVRDEQVLIAVAAASGALCRFSGPPLFDTGSRVLVILSGIPQLPSVQRQARYELEALVRF